MEILVQDVESHLDGYMFEIAENVVTTIYNTKRNKNIVFSNCSRYTFCFCTLDGILIGKVTLVVWGRLPKILEEALITQISTMYTLSDLYGKPKWILKYEKWQGSETSIQGISVMLKDSDNTWTVYVFTWSLLSDTGITRPSHHVNWDSRGGINQFVWPLIDYVFISLYLTILICLILLDKGQNALLKLERLIAFFKSNDRHLTLNVSY